MLLAPKNPKNKVILSYTESQKKSYLPHTNKKPKITVDYIRNELLKDESEKVKALFGILDKQTEIYLFTNEGYAPIPWQTLAKYGYKKAMERLIELKLVEYKDYIRPKGELPGYCTEYRVRLDLFYKITLLSVARVDTYSKRGFALYNLITGKVVRKVLNEKHPIYKYNEKSKKKELTISQIVADGINPIEYTVVNYFHVEEQLDHYRWLFEAKDTIKNLKDHKYYESVKEAFSERNFLSYLNNERSWQNTLANRNFEKLEKINKEWRGYLKYKPIYKAQSTGRKSEVGGGFQSCSREMKHEAFNYLPNVRNYDLKSSQIYCLRYQFMACRLDYTILDKYLQADKKALAKEINVDKDTWKGITYGTYFGGFPTYKIKHIKIYNSKRDYGTLYSLLSFDIVYKHICNFLGIESYYNQKKRRRDCELINNSVSQTVIKISRILIDFYIQNKPLLDEIEVWHKYISCNFPDSSSYYYDKKHYIFNRSQMPIEITQYQTKKGKMSREGIRKLASHLLQGQEAQFISRLTWYSESDPDCPYKVMSDQHDGLIVIGEITDEYVQRAREETKFYDAHLVEKPYL